MGNCLVTKLKESVNNDNLMVFGGLYVDIKAGNNVYMSVDCPNNSGVTWKIVGNGKFTDSSYTQEYEGDTFVQPYNQVAYVKATGDCKVYCLDDYSAIKILAGGGDVSVYADQILAREDARIINTNHLLGSLTKKGACSAYTNFGIRDGEVNLDVFFGSSVLIALNLDANTKAVGDVANLVNCPIAGVVNLNKCSGIHGDITSFAKCYGATNIVFQGTEIGKGDGVAKSIESLAETWYGLKTNGTTTIFSGNGYITFNGNVIPNTQGGNITAEDGNIKVFFAGVTKTYNGSSWS